MNDARLLGVWRSDGARTRKELAARRDIPARTRRGLSRLFGVLELRFTKTRCYSTLDGNTDSRRYTVVAKDASSVVIVSADPPRPGNTITCIRFEGSRFWINVGDGKFREFFKRRQGPPRRTLR